ncbi:MAG: DUF1194 domain-containing protein [Pseudomonadota bacterium]
MRLRQIALALGLMAAPLPGAACGVELILAMDVSRSVMNDEYDLQMGGLAAAFEDPEVQELIRLNGGVAATVTQWSGEGDQAQSVPWALLTDADSSAAFGQRIAQAGRWFFGAFTAPGDALAHARAMSARNPHDCARKVIDLSGDGKGNRGRGAGAISRQLVAEGFTINALAILGALNSPEVYYRESVIGGPGAFVEIATGFDDYADAIRRKLIRELAPAFAMVPQ